MNIFILLLLKESNADKFFVILAVPCKVPSLLLWHGLYWRITFSLHSLRLGYRSAKNSIMTFRTSVSSDLGCFKEWNQIIRKKHPLRTASLPSKQAPSFLACLGFFESSRDEIARNVSNLVRNGRKTSSSDAFHLTDIGWVVAAAILKRCLKKQNKC